VFALMELAGGNIEILIAVAIVVGFRWPAAWSFVLLTKVTPGVGLLWFAVRREWNQLATALVATGHDHGRFGGVHAGRMVRLAHRV
jgi:hypothetical protein